jgi:hypothetical protein
MSYRSIETVYSLLRYFSTQVQSTLEKVLR